jgi:hypothetical protein
MPQATLFAMMSDTVACVPSGTSAALASDLSATMADTLPARPFAGGEPMDAVDPHETFVVLFNEHIKQAQQDAVNLVKRAFPEKGDAYANYMQLNDASLPGRVSIVKALKGLSTVVSAAETHMLRVAVAFESALADQPAS